MENIYQGVRARLYAGKMGRRCLLASIGSSALRSADFSDSAPRAERERERDVLGTRARRTI